MFILNSCAHPTTAQNICDWLSLQLPTVVCSHMLRAGSKHCHVKGTVISKQVWFTFRNITDAYIQLLHVFPLHPVLFYIFFTRFSGVLPPIAFWEVKKLNSTLAMQELAFAGHRATVNLSDGLLFLISGTKSKLIVY